LRVTRRRAPRKPRHYGGSGGIVVSKVLMSRREFLSSNSQYDSAWTSKIFYRYLRQKPLRHRHFRVLVGAFPLSLSVCKKIYVRIMKVAVGDEVARALWSARLAPREVQQNLAEQSCLTGQ